MADTLFDRRGDDDRLRQARPDTAHGGFVTRKKGSSNANQDEKVEEAPSNNGRPGKSGNGDNNSQGSGGSGGPPGGGSGEPPRDSEKSYEVTLVDGDAHNGDHDNGVWFQPEALRGSATKASVYRVKMEAPTDKGQISSFQQQQQQQQQQPGDNEK